MPQGTGGMGTGSDTRIYSPRSESSHMFRNNHEEDTYGNESQKVRDEKMDKKIRQKEKTKDKMDKIKHIRVKPSDIQQFLEQEDEETDDSEKVDADRELSAQTGPVGNLGALTSLATQARGPGFAGGYAFAAGEPMDMAWRLLKFDENEFNPETGENMQMLSNAKLRALIREGMNTGSLMTDSAKNFRRIMSPSPPSTLDELRDIVENAKEFERIEEAGAPDFLATPNTPTAQKQREAFAQLQDELIDEFEQRMEDSPFPERMVPDEFAMPEDEPLDMAVRDPGLEAEHTKYMTPAEIEEYYRDVDETRRDVPNMGFDPSWQDVFTGEPMDLSFRLLKREKSAKSKKKETEKRRRKEKRKEWRPSTGKFKTPPGGSLGPKGANVRRHKARMRSVKRGKLTGLMDAPKAVEMEHRGVAVKQPKSKDPAPYKEFLGQQESRRRLGNVRSPTSSQMRFGARKYYGGKTGGGRLQGMSELQPKRPRLHPVRMPKIQPPAGLSTPHLVKPQMTGAGGAAGMPQMPTATPPMMSGTMEPSMVATGEFGAGSELQKARFGYYEITELRQLINQAKRALARKEKKKKSMGTGDTGGAATTHSRHKQTPTGQTTKPQGATENAEAENIGGVVGVKGGRTA